jgi:hypothetical protein
MPSACETPMVLAKSPGTREVLRGELVALRPRGASSSNARSFGFSLASALRVLAFAWASISTTVQLAG